MQATGDYTEKGLLKTPKAIYPAILADQEVPLLEKTQPSLEDDAIFLMFAGTDASSQEIFLYYIVSFTANLVIS